MSLKTTRRCLLVKGGLGLGGRTLAGLCPAGFTWQRAADLIDPLAPSSRQFDAKAKINHSGASERRSQHVDLTNYKPTCQA